jgi:sugar O-acyltransferase (sialic acid O-acetyltransferase NeuD family)
MALPYILIGAGGHARVILDILELAERKVLGCVATNSNKGAIEGNELLVLGNDSWLSDHPQQTTIFLAMGIGSIVGSRRDRPLPRETLYLHYRAMGYDFPILVHPMALVSKSVQLQAGVQVMAGAVVQPGCKVLENATINTHATVDHDCTLGAHVHIAPGATLSGGVTVGDGTLVGVGATVLQGIRIGIGCTVGAGAVVTKNVPDGQTVVGVPAKVFKVQR